MKFKWNPILYDSKHDFVFKYGEEVVNLLNPRKDENILDIGCGTGDLTKKILDLCKKIIGLDSSDAMIKIAREKFPEIDFKVGDAKDFIINESFDAVFSNSVLHWIPEAEKVIKNINKHLKPGGRFVAEFGGKGCVNKIITELTDILGTEKINYPKIEDNLYYPTIGEYSALLEKNGFELNYALLFDRPTELTDEYKGLKNFIEMFLNWLFVNVSESDKIEIIEKASDKLKPVMFNGKSWVADYRRIRILAVKK